MIIKMKLTLYRTLFLLLSLLPLITSAQFRYPEIIFTDGNPMPPAPFKIVKEQWGLQGPVKMINEYTSTYTEEDKRIYFHRVHFNKNGVLELDEFGGPYGKSVSVYAENGVVKYGNYELTFDERSRVISAVNKTTRTSFSYKDSLLTGQRSIIREVIEAMDGSTYVQNEDREEQYRYDAKGRLTETVKKSAGKDFYRIRYYYNKQGWVDSLVEQGDQQPLIRYAFTYRTENGRHYVRYEEKDPGKAPQDRANGEFEFNAEGRITAEKHYLKKNTWLKSYELDSRGNWIKINHRRITETDKNWYNYSDIREITYH